MNVQSQFSGAVNVVPLWGSQQFQQHICKQLLMFTLSSAAQLWCKSPAQMHYSSIWQVTVLDTSSGLRLCTVTANPTLDKHVGGVKQRLVRAESSVVMVVRELTQGRGVCGIGGDL